MNAARLSSALAITAMAALIAAACADNPSAPAVAPGAPRATAEAGTLQWFGYTGLDTEAATLAGAESYSNFGQLVTDANAGSTTVGSGIDALAQHGMKAVVDLGKLLWAPPAYTNLYPDYVSRWNTWKSANAAALTSDKVLAFIVYDEPFHNGADIAQYQAAAAMVKDTFPWAKLILVEAADEVASPDLYSNWNRYNSLVSTVDWVGVDRYGIHPQTDATFNDALAVLKARFRGHKTVYVMDAYWDAAHADPSRLGPGTSELTLRDVADEWYNVARADTSAVLLSPFIWSRMDGATTSRDLPPYVLGEHATIGRAITNRTFSHAYTATGSFSIGADGYVTGWACDPDAAWGESVIVRMYMDGVLYNSGGGDQADQERTATCRNGSIYHGLHIPLGIGTIGHRMTATVQDLDGNQVAISSTCKDAPACVWYPNNYLPIGQWSLSSTGLVTGWTCDKDAPAASIGVRVAANLVTVGTYTANVASESAINTQCGGGTAHRFSIQLASTTRGQTIYVYGEDTMSGETYLGNSGSRTW